MSPYILSPGFKKFFHLCYRYTFILAIFNTLFFVLFVIFSLMYYHSLDENNFIFWIVSYIAGISLLSCIISIGFLYPLGYLWQLWQENQKKEFAKGLILFILLNGMTGYVWFYYSEIKNQKIRMEFPPYPKIKEK
ncbi:MAG: hypothetical protein FE834_07180 [Gammaproteobacteria bacterium]|nr:hypothetical protein [Gammaproteobacteria bacterium]